jgi:hypothetical protein
MQDLISPSPIGSEWGIKKIRVSRATPQQHPDKAFTPNNIQIVKSLMLRTESLMLGNGVSKPSRVRCAYLSWS